MKLAVLLATLTVANLAGAIRTTVECYNSTSDPNTVIGSNSCNIEGKAFASMALLIGSGLGSFGGQVEAAVTPDTFVETASVFAYGEFSQTLTTDGDSRPGLIDFFFAGVAGEGSAFQMSVGGYSWFHPGELGFLETGFTLFDQPFTLGVDFTISMWVRTHIDSIWINRAPTSGAYFGVEYELKELDGTRVQVEDTVAPEPGTWLLLGSGLLAIGWRSYRLTALRRTKRDNYNL